MITTANMDKLVNSLKFGNSNERRGAAREIVKIGEDAIEPLIGALQYDNGPTRATAAWALGEIGGSSIRGPLRIALNDSDSQVRKRANEALDKTDLLPVRFAKVKLIRPVLILFSKMEAILDLIANATSTMGSSINGLVSLLFGIGIFSKTNRVKYYYLYSSGHGISLRLDREKLHSFLPSQAPCAKCGTLLLKPGMAGFVFSCPNCHNQQEYAKESLNSARAKLTLVALKKDSKLRQQYLSKMG